MKHLIRRILREQEREKHQLVSLDIDLDSGWKALQKQNEKKMKEWFDAIEWELLTQGLEIEEEEFEEPQVIKDLNALVKAIEEGKKDNYLMRTKNFKRLNLDKEKLAFWRNHLNKPEVQSVWARAKGKIQKWLDGLEKDDAVVIKEQTPVNTPPLHDEGDGDGTYSNPTKDRESSGNVPLQSYSPNKIHQDGKYMIKSVSKRAFFKAVELLIRMKESAWFDDNSEDLDDNPWYRAKEMDKTLKILGLDNTGIADKVFWAAIDNNEGIEDGSITDYSQLNLRAFKRYTYPMFEEVRVWKTIHWSPEVDAFSEDDAIAEVIYDEDGLYASGEWYDTEGYDEEEVDWESEGTESDGSVEELRVIYPADEGGNLNDVPPIQTEE